jgi:hypothetical protein
MGLFSDHRKIKWNGHVIEVESRVAGLYGNAEYSLIVDGRKVDTIHGTMGTFSLRGEAPLSEGGKVVPLVVRIKQGVFSSKYFLEVEGSTQEIGKAS